jgi:hypothetical protein
VGAPNQISFEQLPMNADSDAKTIAGDKVAARQGSLEQGKSKQYREKKNQADEKQLLVVPLL